MRQRVVLDPEPPAVRPDAGALRGEAGDRARRGGFTSVPPSSSSAALWRHWAALQRAGDPAAETQVCLRPQTSGPRRATSATEAGLAPPAAPRVDAVFVIPPSRDAGAARRGRAPETAVARSRARARLDFGPLLAPVHRAARRALSSWTSWRRSQPGQRIPSIGMPRAARRAVLFGLGAVCVGALAAWRPSSSASSAAEGALPSASLPPRSSEPLLRRPSVQSLGPVAAAAPESPDLERLAQLAVDSLASGNRTSAAAHYRELARLAPENGAFVAAARILARPVERTGVSAGR